MVLTVFEKFAMVATPLRKIAARKPQNASVPTMRYMIAFFLSAGGSGSSGSIPIGPKALFSKRR